MGAESNTLQAEGEEEAHIFELLLIALIVLPVTAVANLAAQQVRLAPLLAMLTFGLTSISGPWRLFAAAVRGLSLGEAPQFDPDKPVHRTAALLLFPGLLMLLALSLTGDAAGAGEGSPIALPEAMLELVGAGALHLSAAFLGVGWVMRRRLPEVVRRLCLRWPTLREAGISIGVGAGLWIMSTAAVAAWERAVPADVFLQQTEAARLYYQAFAGSLAAALLVAVVPAVSEEIFYRGALQPVFGVFLSSLVFTAIHLQYAWTPAALILFAVALGFAWLRLRFHTSAAIIGHAVYNILPFLAGA